MSIADCDIGCLDINPVITSALRRAHLTNQKKVLSLSIPDLERLTGLSTHQVISLKNTIASRFVPVQKCRGGLLSGLLTEVVGESACGKTQLCLQMCVSAQLQKKGSVYISTEDVFPSKRLQQIIQFHSRRHNRKDLGDGIFIEHVSDFDTLDFCVSKRLPTLLNRGDVSMVVIDSVAALFRCHYDSSQMVERAEHLIRFASVLHNLASEHNIPIVCVNQVTSSTQASTAFRTSGNLVPSLGITWANQIHCRITMSRPSSLTIADIRNRLQKQSPDVEPTWRQLNVSFSPHLPPSEIVVYIDNAGIHGLETHSSR